MTVKNKRNGVIELMRFLMVIPIVLGHTKEFLSDKIVTRGYLGVEFFFVVSGYLMMASLSRKKGEEIKDLGKETWSFVVHKWKALMPNYLVAFIVAAVGMFVVQIRN